MNGDNPRYLTVSAINRYIGYKIDSDVALNIVYVKGEISNVRISKGHLYFVLKDETSEISGIIFSNTLKNSLYIPKDGAKVLITGSVQSYVKRGGYNLLVSKISEFGQGLIYQRFLDLKQKLEKEGLFDESHKKPIPKYCERISVITSDTGDAIQDIISTINKRFPIAKIYVYKALVQGDDAPLSIIKALKKASSDNYGEVIIIARGGGSIEDLNCFNDEQLAREIYNCNIPIVSGVGHENDYTICDFVSDDRAPTPTGAAVRVTPDKNIIIQNIINYQERLNNSFSKKISNYENDLLILKDNYYFKSFDKVLNEKIKEINHLSDKLASFSPISIINRYDNEITNLNKRIHIFDLSNRINSMIESIASRKDYMTNQYSHNLERFNQKFVNLIDKLILVNPLNIMKKGYTLVFKKNDKKLITSSKDIKNDDELEINFHDGKVSVKVQERKS